MDDRETQEAGQEDMNGSEASSGESAEIPEKIIIGSGGTSGRSSAAIEIDDIENGDELENEEDDISKGKGLNESAYRSPITSLQIAEQNDYEDDFENESDDEEKDNGNRKQMDESDDDDDDDNIGSVSDGEINISSENFQNGYVGLHDKDRPPSSSTDDLMVGYKERGSVVSDMFSDFSEQLLHHPDSSNTDPKVMPLGSKFDRLRSAYTRPTKSRQLAQQALLSQSPRSRPSRGYYLDPDELKV
jgi:hypothetical protein